MFNKNIEDLVREYVDFNHGYSKNWNKVYCEVCGDGSRTKGPRGGWLFNDEMAFYHCFNCNIEGNFDPNREYPLSKEMKTIFDSFHVPEKEYYTIAYKNRILDDKKLNKPKRKKIDIEVMELPDYFYLLNDAKKDNVIAAKAYEELAYRNINPDDYPFYLSNGKSKMGVRHEAIAKSLVNRLIIPFFDNKADLIYYQARALDKTNKKRYINADVSRSNIIYGMNQLYTNTTSPLYVTEGFFDAYHLKGVSLQENNMTQGQIELLKRSPRQKVFIPDKKSDSSKIVDQFIKLDWKISVPDIGSSCKDVDDSVRKYGRLYTCWQVANNIHNASDAKLLLKMFNYL